MACVFVGVGSNIDPEANIRAGMQALREIFGRLRLSSIYQSPAFGFDGADFLNLVVEFESGLDPDGVARVLREVEIRFGRAPGPPKYSSRTLDLDLLLYDDLVAAVGTWKVPRPDITRFGFVLCPLAELAGDRRHPETGERFRDMWRGFQGEGSELRCVDVSAVGDSTS